jgi:hypothetical protein
LVADTRAQRRYWFLGGEKNTPAPHFHKFSSWVPTALWERRCVTGDDALLRELLDDTVADYRQWERERLAADGLFWQYDVRDGMEESISGSRRDENRRPAIARTATAEGRDAIAVEFQETADRLQALLNERLWDEDAQFYKVRRPDGSLSDAREAIGFLPWRFDLAPPGRLAAWKQLADPAGFWAPRGLTTAERRHPQFRTHGTGTCEWDGAVWPFATSQTLDALQNVLRGGPQDFVSKRDFFEQLLAYADAHQRDAAAYIGEYHDETTGKWLITGEKERRSRYYNHSTFADLVIRGLVGIVPLMPEDGWEWFSLDGVRYHGHDVAVLWDQSGRRFGRGAGLGVYVDGRLVQSSKQLTRVEVVLPRPGDEK